MSPALAKPYAQLNPRPPGGPRPSAVTNDRLGLGLSERPGIGRGTYVLRLRRALRPEAHVLAAAEAAERYLVVAADALGVRTQRGRWWLPSGGGVPG